MKFNVNEIKCIQKRNLFFFLKLTFEIIFFKNNKLYLNSSQKNSIYHFYLH